MRHVALLFAALCLLAAPTAVVATGTPGTGFGPPDRAAPRGASALAVTAFAAPATDFAVAVRDDGSARWTVTATFRFETEAERAAFETYADRYEADETVGGPSAVVFRNAAARAANATGREMAVREVNRTGELVNETAGVLRLNFTWTGFVGRSESGQLVLADVFRTAENTTWFRTLQSGQRLVIAPPEGYTTSDVSSSPSLRYQFQNQRIVITGPAALEADQLAIRYTPTQATTPPPNDGMENVFAGVLVGGVLLAAVAALLYRREAGRRDEAGGGPAVGADADGPQPTDGGTTSPSTTDGASVPETGAGAEGAGAAGPAETEGGTDEGEDEEDVELLSDEERVERLLDRNGGRMRQAAIVQETGWSDAKVSQLLSAMAEEERVEKLRLGRENLISLPDRNGDGNGGGGAQGA